MDEILKSLQDYSVKMLDEYREAFESVNITHIREFTNIHQKVKARLREGKWQADPSGGYTCTCCQGVTNIPRVKGTILNSGYYFCPRCGARMTNMVGETHDTE